MKKLVYLGIMFLLAFSLIIIILPVGLTEKQVDNIIKIIPAFFAAAGLMVTISLYDRFGLKKMLYEKKIKATLAYIEALRNLRIYYSINLMEPWGYQPLNTGFIRLSSDMSDLKQELAAYLNIEIFVYGANIDAELNKLYPFIDDMYLPKNLSSFPYHPRFHESTLSLPKEHGILVLGDINTDDYDGKLVDYLNGRKVTINEFINTVEAFMQECKAWIEKHTDLDKEIKI